MRILHLQRSSIWGYSAKEITDLTEYYRPDITLTSELGGEERRKIDNSTIYEAVHLEELDGIKKRDLGNETVLMVPKSISFSEIGGLDLESKDQLSIISDSIEGEMDPTTFEFSLTGTELIEILKEYFDLDTLDVNLFSTKIEAGKNPHHDGIKIHGLKTKEKMDGPHVPFVLTGKRPHIELLPAGRVGLSAVPDLGDRFSTMLQSKGIESREDLCSISPEKMIEMDGVGPYRGTKWVCSAKALEDDTIYRLRENDLEDKHKLFVDIETDSLDPRIIWHIGLYDCEREKYICFLEKDPSDKGSIMDEFSKYLERYGKDNSCLLSWYGSKFDFVHLESFIEEYAPEYIDVWDHIEKIDFMDWTKRHAALPCRTSKLDHVASRLDYEWSIRGLDGAEVGRLYSEYMDDEREEMPWKELKLYGKDDVIAMYHIYEEIRKAPLTHDMEEVERKYRKL